MIAIGLPIYSNLISSAGKEKMAANTIMITNLIANLPTPLQKD
jgi:hypothetical protein